MAASITRVTKKKQQTNNQTKEIDNFVQFDRVTFIIFKETKY